MEQTFKVPIRNLFCLLSYANHMPELVHQLRDVDEEVITLDFLAKRFNAEAGRLLKRGLMRSYVDRTMETNRVGGRLVIGESLPYLMENKPVVVCEKDEFSRDTIFNQLLKTTLENVYKSALVREETRRQSFLLWEQMPDVSTVFITREIFLRLAFTRMTAYYKPAIHLARLLHEMKLLSHKQGKWSLFSAELSEMEMNQLFETFLLNFYRSEQDDYVVKSEQLTWRLEGNRQFLPGMQTDVSMLHKNGTEKIVMDAKFYKNMFQQHRGKASFHSDNMYQMLAYLMHQPPGLRLRGILIYPYNGHFMHETFRWDERTDFEVRSINLDDSWSEIHRTLLDILAA